MGLFLRFRRHPTPLDSPDNGLAAFVNVDMLDTDLLRGLAAISLQGLELGGKRAILSVSAQCLWWGPSGGAAVDSNGG
jgi:hypothetical protein